MHPDWLRSADEQLLRYFETHPPDYVPLAANRLGLHLGYAERRVAVLVEHGLLESVTNESIYTVTEAGRQALRTQETAPVAADD
jgi:DNA-binding MarR family transcriptional regulator